MGEVREVFRSSAQNKILFLLSYAFYAVGIFCILGTPMLHEGFWALGIGLVLHVASRSMDWWDRGGIQPLNH